MNAFQIKVYLFPQNVNVCANNIGQANEIRRFNLAKSFNIYNDLVEKIQSAYGSLLPNKNEIRTYWQDEENELVGFSTETEMQYAIDLQTAIRVSKPYESSNPIGSIFKVYVARKSTEPQTSSAKPAEANNEQNEIHYGVVCDGCDSAIVGIRYKCSSCDDYDLCSKCHDKGIHNEHPFNKISKPIQDSFRKCPYSGRNRGFFRRYHRQHNTCPTQSASSNTSHANPIQQVLNDYIPYITNSIPIVNDPEQLKNVGEYLKQFLDPFGIDVDYYVDTKNKNNEEKKETKETASSEPSTSKHMDDTVTPKEAKMDTETEAEIIIEKLISPTAPANEESKEASPYKAAADALKNAIEKNSNIEAEVEIEKIKEKKMDESLTEDSGFNLVDIEKELKIIKSIEQLRSMGYSDDGGWLTRLATAKEGNLNAILDTISPFGSKSSI